MLSYGLPMRHLSATPEVTARLSQLALGSTARRFSTTPDVTESRPPQNGQHRGGQASGLGQGDRRRATRGQLNQIMSGVSTSKPRMPIRYVDGPPSGSPDGNRPVRVLRAPAGLRNNLQRGGGRFPNNRGSPGGFQQRGRGPRSAGPSGGAQRSKSRRPRGAASKRRNDKGKSEVQMSEKDKAEWRKYEAERQEAQRPKPVPFNPQGYDVENLRETWPALPMGETAQVSSIMEKFTWMSDRVVGTYEPTDVLRDRLQNGKRVLFKNEEEKNRIVKNPKDFNPISKEERRAIIGRLISGDYSDMQATEPNSHPVVENVMRNLRNNGTYQNAQTAEIMKKLSGMLPPVKKVSAEQPRK